MLVSPPAVRSLCDHFLQGTLDIMVQRTGEQGQGNVLFVQNNFYYDAFFLKAIGKSSPRRLYPFSYVSYQFSTVAVQAGGVTLRMAPNSMCVLPSNPGIFSYIFPQPFGVSYSGATYKYTVLDTTGQRAAAAGAQRPLTRLYHALSFPQWHNCLKQPTNPF